ncbi:MAG TPA: glycosyltransferase family 4 protein [Solirubrobacterales bacterium]|jgi:glycosyltransferase involved in cell wall biosynthesis|nr:glycosyltransferase family 4 protein [Solirubrobacterales bacterium]
MRIGICSWWFNRGQAVVGRYLRSALEELGHETFVLARPTRGGNIRPSFIDRTGVWDQPGVTEASSYEIPVQEYEDWVEAIAPEIVFFDQNYQFAEIATVRRMGVKTVGRFVWEAFAPADVPPATDAFDLIYSLTECEHRRYRELGIDSPKIDWGCHPELLSYAKDHPATNPPGAEAAAAQAGGNVVFIYPGGFMSKRKPFEAVIEAFSRVRDPRLRLTFKAQVERRVRKVGRMVKRDPRIEVIWEDLPTSAYLRLFAGSDVCLAPSRWEGLGLHLYEATAFGMPIITNDNPPMNEVVTDGANGLLVRGIESGTTKSGIAAYEPDVDGLAAAIERLADDALRADLSRGALELRERLSWDRTVRGYARLIDEVAARSRAGAGRAV